jgi:hypothetical protein
MVTPILLVRGEVMGRFSWRTVLCLLLSGWLPNRHKEIERARSALAAHGYFLNQSAVKFLEEFEMLNIGWHFPSRLLCRGQFYIDTIAAINMISRETIASLELKIQKQLCIVGQIGGYMAILISGDGMIYGTEGVGLYLVGKTIDEGIENMCRCVGLGESLT